jgi:hypothetical protein
MHDACSAASRVRQVRGERIIVRDASRTACGSSNVGLERARATAKALQAPAVRLISGGDSVITDVRPA